MNAARLDEYSRMGARQEEVRKVITYVSERQGKRLAMMERKRNLMSKAPEDHRKQTFQEISGLDERISAKEMVLLERRRILEDLLKEGRNAEVEEGRVKVTAGGGITRQAVAGS